MKALEKNLNFEKLHQNFVSGQDSSSCLVTVQKSNFERLLGLQKPNRKHESWQYSSNKWLEGKSWVLAQGASEHDLAKVAVQSDEAKLVFVNGVFSLDKSHLGAAAGLEIKSLENFVCKNSKDLESFNEVFPEKTQDYFSQLNESFLKQGFVFKVANQDSDKKVKINLSFEWSHGTEAKACFVKNYFLVEPNSSLCVTEEHKTEEILEENSELFSSSYCDFILRRNSQVRYKKMFSESVTHRQVSGCGFYLEESSKLESFFVSLGGKLYRQDVMIKLAGKGAEAWANGLYLSGTKQSSDFSFIINHESPQTKSHQYFKGVCGGSGKGIFQGKIVVGEKASLTRAKQLNKNLLLSEEAQIFTKPQLQIDTDDVKCAHGATVSQIREEELFYLQTRGLTKAEANSFLIEGFCHEILALEEKKDKETFKEKVQEKIRNLLQEKLG